RLRAARVRAVPINHVPAAFASAWAAGSTVELAHPVLGPTTQVAPPFHLSRTPAAVRTPPPPAREAADRDRAELRRRPSLARTGAGSWRSSSTTPGPWRRSGHPA